MPCSSIYCLSNTGYPTFDDIYFSAGTHNSELYWTGQTNGLFIYYNTGSTQWCLSTALDGTCDLSGQSPCFNPCPDLDDIYFNINISREHIRINISKILENKSFFTKRTIKKTSRYKLTE